LRSSSKPASLLPRRTNGVPCSPISRNAAPVITRMDDPAWLSVTKTAQPPPPPARTPSVQAPTRSSRLSGSVSRRACAGSLSMGSLSADGACSITCDRLATECNDDDLRRVMAVAAPRLTRSMGEGAGCSSRSASSPQEVGGQRGSGERRREASSLVKAHAGRSQTRLS